MEQQTAPTKGNGLKIVLIVLAVMAGLGILGTVIAGYAMKSLWNKVTEGVTGLDIKTDLSGDVTSYTNPATGESVKIKKDASGNVTGYDVTGENGGSVTFGSQALPAGFPSDFPLMPEMVRSTAYGGDDEGGSSFFLGFSTPKSLEELRAYYNKELTAKGWKRVSDTGTAIGFQLDYEKIHGETSDVVTVTGTSMNNIVTGSITINLTK